MMRALVTGGNGFVGRHLVAELRGRGDAVVVAGRAQDGAVDVAIDLADARGLRSAVAAARPDVVFHLAAQASVGDAARATVATYATNVLGTAELLEAVRAAGDARIVFASSGEVYGAGTPQTLPFEETALPAPATAYAASKVAAEAIVLAEVRARRTRALVVRTFNLIGPGQSERFVVAAFARRLAAIAAGGPPRFPVGNLTPARDFLDVRDAVRAYADLARDGRDGEIYNVCSGAPVAVSEILRRLVLAARVPVEIREDPELVRPVDVAIAYGSNRKLREQTPWDGPRFALERTLRDVLAEALGRAGVRGPATANERPDDGRA